MMEASTCVRAVRVIRPQRPVCFAAEVEFVASSNEDMEIVANIRSEEWRRRAGFLLTI